MLGFKSQEIILLLREKGALRFHELPIKDYANFKKVMGRLKKARLVINYSRRIKSNGDPCFFNYYQLTHKGRRFANELVKFK